MVVAVLLGGRAGIAFSAGIFFLNLFYRLLYSRSNFVVAFLIVSLSVCFFWDSIGT